MCACAVGGMAAIKRPAEESNEEPSGKKNQPVAAKVFVSPKPATEAQKPKSPNDNKVLTATHCQFSSPVGPLNCLTVLYCGWSVCNEQAWAI